MDPILLMDKKDQLSFEILSLINRAADAPVNMDHVADTAPFSVYASVYLVEFKPFKDINHFNLICT